MIQGMEAVARHKTAMSRGFLSRPMQQAHADGLLEPGVTVFDYGCGRGDDIRHLSTLGLDVAGWDPAHAPDEKLRTSDLVNIGYVVNVIEDPAQRSEALQGAWKLTRDVLVVSARLDWDLDAQSGSPYGDGRMMSSGAFQKFYSQEDLRAWIGTVLGETPITAAPGIFYVFRNPGSAQSLLARQSRGSRPRLGVAELLYRENRDLLDPVEAWVEEHRRLPDPTELTDSAETVERFGSIRAAFSIIRRVSEKNWADIDLGQRKKSEQRFEEHIDDLQPLIDFLVERGRLPREGELAKESALQEEFGSIRAAFSLVRRVTGSSRWEEFETEARDNFLVYAALSAFGGRPKFSDLPEDLQYDAKDLFGSYSKATEHADRLLFSIADLEKINEACQQSPFGKMTPEALYVHVDGIEKLPPLLRVYQGAARTLTGDVDDATILKLHRLKPQVSFLVYPTFDKDPHPALQTSIVARLPELRVSFRNFGDSENPPILHRKELMTPNEYAGRAKFERLTRQEEKAGLLEQPMGNKRDWEAQLQAAGVRLAGHRLTKLD